MPDEIIPVPPPTPPTRTPEEQAALSERMRRAAQAPRLASVGRGRMVRLLGRQVERVNKMIDVEDVSMRVVGLPSPASDPVIHDPNLVGSNSNIRQEIQALTALFKAINDVDLGERGAASQEKRLSGVDPNLIGTELDPNSDDRPPDQISSTVRLRAIMATIEQTVRASKVPPVKAKKV